MREDLRPTIILDTREPGSHPWELYLTCPTVRGTLTTGDLTLAGCQDYIAVERKSLDDLVGCLTHSRERFVKELRRGQRIPDFFVICEGSYGDLFRGNYHSQMNSRSAWESVVCLQQRYGIPFFMAGNVELAAKLAESILLRWFKEHVKAVQSAQRGLRVVSSG